MSLRWLAAGLLLLPLVLAAPASAGDDYSSPGNVLHIVPETTTPSARSTSVEVSYSCAPTDGDVQLSLRFRSRDLVQANNWARGYPFTPARCDGSLVKQVLVASAYPETPDDEAGYRTGEMVEITADLTEYEPTQPEGPRPRAALAGDRLYWTFLDPLRCHELDGVLTPFAGIGSPGYALGASEYGEVVDPGDGGQACLAHLAYPTSLVRAADGTVYVADYLFSRIRKIAPDGTISRVAGTGVGGFSGDGGPGTAARLDHPRGLALDLSGRLLIADNVNSRVRRLDPATGVITTVAGTGVWGSSGDGLPATQAQLGGPQGVAVGPDGTIWVADAGGSRVRAIDPQGRISTLAGTGVAGDAGDGGPARLARLSRPRALAVSGSTLLVADAGTSSVRRIDLRSGLISTVVGPSTGRPVHNPASMLPVATGLLVTEAGEDRVLRVDGASGVVSTFAGGAKVGDVPLPPLGVALRQPQGLAAGPDGSVLIADTGHHRLLQLTPAA